MKKQLVVLLIPFVIGLTGCTIINYPIKGTYSNTPYTVISEEPFDQVWNKVIDLFATKGLSIAIIDKSSGLIVSKEYSFIDSYTFENDNGSLANPSAFIVVSRIEDPNWLQMVKPNLITGDWNVRISDGGSGKTKININLTNLIAKGIYRERPEYLFQAKSTGSFEKMIGDLLIK